MINRYDVMWKDIKVGVLEEHLDDYGRTLRIILEKPNGLEQPYDLCIRAENNIVDNETVWWWVNDRITPKTQDGIEEKLKKMGLSEYDPWEIFKYNNGMTTDDFSWVKFHPEKDWNYHILSKYAE